MKGLFIPEITAEMFRNGCLESIETLMAKGEIYDIEYSLEQDPTDNDCISRQAVLDGIDVKAWEFCDYLINKGRNDEQKPVSHFADNLREYIREELPSVNPKEPKTEQKSILDKISEEIEASKDCGRAFELGLDMAIKIISKYRQEE